MCLLELVQISKVFQGAATGLAILIGAIWAMFRFYSLREIKQMKLNMEKQKRELQQQPVLDLSMTTDQLDVTGDPNHYIRATVIAKNNGNQVARMAYEEEPALSVYFVNPKDQSLATYEKEQELRVRLASNPNSFARTTIVRPGQTQEVPFLLKLPKAGWYFVAFRSKLSKADRKILTEAGVPNHRIVSWTAKKYLYVSKS